MCLFGFTQLSEVQTSVKCTGTNPILRDNERISTLMESNPRPLQWLIGWTGLSQRCDGFFWWKSQELDTENGPVLPEWDRSIFEDPVYPDLIATVMPVICDVISAHHYCKDWNQLKQPQPGHQYQAAEYNSDTRTHTHTQTLHQMRLVSDCCDGFC